MRIINSKDITYAVKKLSIEANYFINEDILKALEKNMLVKNLLLEKKYYFK